MKGRPLVGICSQTGLTTAFGWMGPQAMLPGLVVPLQVLPCTWIVWAGAALYAWAKLLAWFPNRVVRLGLPAGFCDCVRAEAVLCGQASCLCGATGKILPR